MQSLEKSLNLKNVGELKQIAREHKISGFASLKKAELITLLAQNMKFKVFYDNLREKLIDTMLLFLDLILEEGGTRKYSDVKIDFLDFRSASTFYKIFNQLSTYGLIFEEETEAEESEIYIPKELIRGLQKIVRGKVPVITAGKEPQEIIEDDFEDDMTLYSSFKTMDGLFYSSFLPIENLKNFLTKNNIDVEGAKKELINKTLYDAHIKLEDVIDQLFSKTILQDICFGLQIPKSGIKQDIINRILEKLPLQKAKRVKKVIKGKVAVSVGSSAAKSKREVKISPEPPKTRKVRDAILYEDPEGFITYLKNLRPTKPRDERDLANYLNGILTGKFGDKVHIEESAKRGNIRYDIALAETVLLELKVAKTKNTVITGMGQIQHYLGQTQKYKYGILGVFDATNHKNLNSQFSYRHPNYYIVFW